MAVKGMRSDFNVNLHTISDQRDEMLDFDKIVIKSSKSSLNKTNIKKNNNGFNS